MPLNERKIITMILEQCAEIDERCEGYRDAIVDVISDVLAYERGHMVSATNIQQKVDDKLNAAAQFLVSHEEGSERAKEEES